MPRTLQETKATVNYRSHLCDVIQKQTVVHTSHLYPTCNSHADCKFADDQSSSVQIASIFSFLVITLGFITQWPISQATMEPCNPRIHVRVAARKIGKRRYANRSRHMKHFIVVRPIAQTFKRNQQGIAYLAHAYVFVEPFRRIGEAQNPGPLQEDLYMSTCNPTAIALYCI